MIWKIHESLKTDPLIQAKVGSRIKFYEYPETGDMNGPYIIIDPLATPRPVRTGDNKRIVYEYFYQIDVWSKSLDDTNKIMEIVSDILWNIGFGENGGGVDEYDSDTAIHRQAKRFIGQFQKI